MLRLLQIICTRCMCVMSIEKQERNVVSHPTPDLLSHLCLVAFLVFAWRCACFSRMAPKAKQSAKQNAAKSLVFLGSGWVLLCFHFHRGPS